MTTTAIPTDLEVEVGHPDPFMDDCPSWCDSNGKPHQITGHDCDRGHFGEIVKVPLRHLGASYYRSGPDGPAFYNLAHVEMYLRRHPLHREAHVHADLSGTSASVKVTLIEAERIGRALLAMVEAAR